MNINWDPVLHFNPKTLGPAEHGIPLPTYGNYGGPNYSAGVVGGTTPPTPDPPPKDDLDALFYQHDRVYEISQDPAVLLAADVQLIEQMDALTFTVPGEPNYDPEAGLYEGFATLAIVGQLAAAGALPDLPKSDQLAIAAATQNAVENLEAGLAAVPGEARSLHGAFHIFEHQFLDLLL